MKFTSATAIALAALLLPFSQSASSAIAGPADLAPASPVPAIRTEGSGGWGSGPQNAQAGSVVQTPSPDSRSTGPDTRLPWFLTDMRPPDHPPPGFVMPSIRVHGGGHSIDPATLPDYGNMTVTDEQLEGGGGGRTVYPLLHNYSISVSFEWDATTADFQGMDGGLRRFSEFVHDFTDGQFTIGKFDIYNNKNKWDTANIHVLNIPMYRANAQYGGYLYGGIIQIGRDAWGQTWDSAMGAVILAHEFGHYGLLLPDEYIDATGQTLCDDPSANTCIMSNPYSEFEICTDESHDKQATQDPASCWSYIKYYYPNVVEVHGVPDSGPGTGLGCTVTWHYPNLYISPGEMTVQPSTANEGDNISITFPVHNSERLVTSTVTVNFYYDAASTDKLFKTVNLNMAGQDTGIASARWTALGGSHTIIGVIDPANSIKETTKGDNQAYRTVTINNRPKISPKLAGFTSREDVPITVRMTQYATDVEDPAASLKWSVVKFNNRAIASVLHGPNQTLTFDPVLHWWGTTPVTLSVADSGSLTAQKEINLTFTYFNYPPSALDPAFSVPAVLRGRSLELSSAAADVEDSPEKLQPVFEWRPPGSDQWVPLSAAYDGNRFVANLSIPLAAPTGAADARVAFIDTGLQQGDWTYLNGNLSLLNNKPAVLGLNFSESSVIRGGLVTLSLQAADLETPGKDLQPSIEYRSSDGEWRLLDLPGDFLQDSWDYTIGFGAGWETGSYDFRAMVNDSDGGGSLWYIDSQALTVSNSLPKIDFVRVSRARLLRGDSALLTVSGNDYETNPANLTLELKCRDSKGRDQGALIGKAVWNGSQWEARFAPSMSAPAGRYSFEARVGDADGGWSEWYETIPTIDVGNNQPRATFFGPAEATEGDSVSFDASNSSDLENHLDVMSFSWSFGDGSKGGTGSRTSHSFGGPGMFRIVLTLTDKDGAVSTAERTINISARPKPPLELTAEMGGMLVSSLVGIIILGAAGAFLVAKRRKKGREQAESGPAGPEGAASPRAAGRVGQNPGMPPAYRESAGADGMTSLRTWSAPTPEPYQPIHPQNGEQASIMPQYHEPLYEAGEPRTMQPGPFPPPAPLPGREPDPLRPPDPEPGPYPEPEPDDDED